jgi:hypothetical protein
MLAQIVAWYSLVSSKLVLIRDWQTALSASGALGGSSVHSAEGFRRAGPL